MKMKFNKACDLSSISILPPRRRSNAVPHGPQGSQVQLQSQPSEQSFSQGLSSQYGMFSQLSQASLGAFTDQRSQYPENSVKKIARLPLFSHTSEESLMQMSRPSNNLTHKWNSASGSDHQRNISDELEHRIGMMETSVSKFGMILDSVQSDVMQVKKGTKEVLMEMETIQQKLMAQDSSLQLVKLLCSTQTCQNHITYPIQTSKALTVLSPKAPKTAGPSIPRVKQTPKLKYMRKYKAPSLASDKGAACHSVTEKRPRSIKKESERLNHPTVPPKACVQPGVVTTLEAGGWKTVNPEKLLLVEGSPQKYKNLMYIHR